MDDPSEKIGLIMALRRQGIVDARVLSAIENVPREEFVEPADRLKAWDDRALPLTCGQTISQPYVVAFMTAGLEVGERDRVLEIGTGSGYQAAVLSHLCRRVYTMERQTPLMRTAEVRLRDLGFDNVTTLLADGIKGWPEQAPFERIIVTAAAAEVPPALLEQLAEGGILVAPIGESRETQTLVRIRKKKGQIESEELLPVRFVPLLKGVARET